MPAVVIVGAGPAGAALALALGRQGIEVALFDKAAFPRDKACGEGLMPSGVAVLQRLGLESVTRAGLPFWGIRYHAGDRMAMGRFPRMAGAPSFGLGQRRLGLDHRLVEAAIAHPTVEWRPSTRVGGLLRRGDRVVGVEVAGEAIPADMVVLADGLHSPLRAQAGLAGAPDPRPRMGLRAHYRLPEGRYPAPWVDVFLGDRRRELYLTPLPDRELLVAALVDQGATSGRPQEAFEALLATEPAMAAILEGAERISPVIGVSPLANSPASTSAPGVVLLGDAAGFIDPITGGGIAQALMTAELLAARMPTLLADPSGDGLARFDGDRRRLLRDYRLVTRGVLAIADHPRSAHRVVDLLDRAPGLFTHMLGVNAGLKPLWRFW